MDAQGSPTPAHAGAAAAPTARLGYDESTRGAEPHVIELDIERLAYGGDAIGHLADGRTVFVNGGCPGDRVAAEVVEDRGRFLRARTREVLVPSPARVVPPCPYFGACGGCSWQHVAADTQLEAKRDTVAGALSRIGHLPDAESLVGPARACGPAYGYRNKIELVATAGVRGLELGFHRAGSEDVIPVQSCALLPARVKTSPKALTGALRYLAGSGDLALQRVSVRVGASTKDIEVALWTDPGPFPRSAAAKVISQALPLTSLVRVLVKGAPRERRVSRVEVLAGKGFWRERLAGLPYLVSAPSFFQVNTGGAEVLVELVLDALAPDGTDRVLDLYAGAGTFTLPLAKVAGEVVAVEAASSAVRDLRRNLEDEGLWADVVGGDAAREITSLGAFDLAVVDPPRSGIDVAVIDALAAARVRTLAYVSCDPATLARDAARLAEAGFTLTGATPIDLFPQTYHVEAVARFARI